MSQIKIQALIDECYRRSVELLKDNATDFGVMASSIQAEAVKKKYINVFGRDGSICALGMTVSGNPELLKIARNTLITLAEYQNSKGQIPNSINPKKKEVLYYILGSIDATLWWLIALKFYSAYSGDEKLLVDLDDSVKRALRWLSYQDTNNCGLLEQGEASGWDDDMPVNGNSLYTNVLWAAVLNLYKKSNQEKLALDGINTLFMPHKANPNQSEFLQRDVYAKMRYNWVLSDVDDEPFYLHYISYRYVSDRCDVYANILAVLFDIGSPARDKEIMSYLRNSKAAKKYPIQVLFPYIDKRDEDWREYLDREDGLNRPYDYHNGGIWPYVGAFWAMALMKVGKEEEAWKELYRVAEANKADNWGFREWLNGKSGKPMGMRGQSWNAGAYILAYHYLNGDFEW